MTRRTLIFMNPKPKPLKPQTVNTSKKIIERKASRCLETQLHGLPRVFGPPADVALGSHNPKTPCVHMAVLEGLSTHTVCMGTWSLWARTLASTRAIRFTSTLKMPRKESLAAVCPPPPAPQNGQKIGFRV